METAKIKNLLTILFCVLLFVCSTSGFAQQTRFTINGQNASPTVPVSVCVNTPVSFDNTSTGGATNPRWIFKGGSPSTGTTNSVTNVSFSTPGTDSATLIVTRGANQDTLKVPILVVANTVTAEFSSSPSGQCANVPVGFTNQSTGAPGLAYNWAFGDPNSGAANNASTQTNPTHKFVGTPGNASQSFSVRLIARNTIGCADTISKNVTVRQLPGTELDGIDSITYEGKTFFRICTSDPSGDVIVINKSSTSTTNTNYQIRWGNGNPDFFSGNTMPNQTIAYSVGIYNLSFIVTGGNGCKDTANYGVFVGSNPAVGLGNPGNTSICTGSTLTFPVSNTATNPPGTFYTVTFNDGSNPLMLQHPAPSSVTHQFDKTSCGTTTGSFPNSFQATITATNPCLSSQATVVPIYVSEKARAIIGIGPRDTVCTGMNLAVNDNSGNISFISGNTCSGGRRVWSITPSTGFSISGTLGSENGLPLTPNLWSTGSDNLNLNFSQPGIYTIKLKVGNPVCGRDSVVRTICVNPAPIANFTANNLTGCAPLTVNTTNTSNSPNCETNSYQWSVAYTPAPGCTPSVSDYTLLGGTTLTSEAPIFRFNNPGTYTLSLVTRNSGGICPSPAFSRQIVVKDKPNANFNLPAAVCVGASINLSSTTNNCGGTTATGFNWVIPGGNPASSTAANPGTVVFNTAGNPTIRLTATNECGDTVVTRPLLINPTPEVTVPADTAFCRGQLAGPFTFSAQPASATINWTTNNTAIGLAASGNGNIGAFTTTNAGNATITVRPVLGTCTGTAKTFALVVNPLPAAPVVPPVPTYCVGDVAQPLDATALTGHTLRWYTVATGGTALASTPTPPTTTAGTTSWWVSQVANATGCEGPRTQVTVRVFPIPTIASATGVNPSTCAVNNGSIVLSGLQPNTSYTVSYTRNGVPQTATLASNASGDITIASLVAGVYDNIRVSVGGGCASAPRGPISLSDPNPPATPVVTANGPLCTGSTLSLTASSATPGSLVYTWSGPNGFSTTTQNPSLANITLAAQGTYSVTARLGNCTSPAGTVQVVVNPTPTVTATSNSPVCSGSAINLTASSPNGANVTYAWTGPDNFTSTEQNPSIANAAAVNAGTYRVTGTLGVCPSQERIVQVVVNPTPAIASVVPSNPTNCATATGSIQLTGLNPNTSFTVTYSRDGAPFSANLVSNAAGNLTIPNLAAGTYSNIRVSALGCISAPAGPVTLSDPNAPAPPIVGSNSPLCIGSTIRLTATGIGTGSYRWTGPNGFTSTAPNPEIPNAGLTNSGNYSVTFTVNNCISAPATVNVAVSQNASIPNAGPDQQLCNATQTTLQAATLTNGTGLWTVVPGSTAQVVNPTSTAASVNNLPIGLTRLVWTVTNNVCPPGSDTVDIVNLPPVTQTISPGDAVICEGQSVTLSGTAPTGGTGSYQYQWQQSSNNIAFTDITNANSPDYVVAPTTNTWYRRQVTSGACQHLSDTILVTVRPSLANNRITGPTEICINTAPSLITGTTPTGGEGNYVYSWEQSQDGGTTWTVIPNETGKDYQPPVLTQTTSYRRIVSTALCQGPQSLASDAITITVRPDAQLVWQPAPLTGCTPFTINPTRLNLDHQPDRNSTYRWFVNGVQVGTALTFPGHTLSNPGDTAVIKAVAVSSFGCRNDSAAVTFRTIGNPAPSFSISDSVGCGPINIAVSNATPNLSGFTYRWDFGNGQQSTAANPGAINFARNPDFGDTLYTIILYASNGCDTLSVSKTIRVRAPAKAIINPDKVEGCSPARFTFSNNSRGSGASYTWNFGDGSPDLETNDPVINYTYNTGVRRIYPVQLISRNDCGADTARVNLVVSPNPIQVNVLADANRLNGCTPHTVQFINNTIGATTFRYNFGDGTPEVVSSRQFDTVLHTYPTPGTYTFAMTALSGCTDTTIQRTVVVEAKPVAAFTRNPGAVCIGEPVRFTSTSSAGAAIQWSFGDGTGSGLANLEKSFAQAGTYRVTLYATTSFGLGFTCTDSATATVIVRDTLPGNFTITNAGNCAPFAITFKTSLPNAATTFWNFGDGTTTTGDSVAHNFVAAGTYTVTMVSVDAGGCAYKAMQSVVVSGPTGQLQYQAPFVCVGNSVTFRAISNNTARYIYYFGNGDSAVSLNNSFTYTYPQPGTYRPYVILQSGNCRSEIWGSDSLKVDRVSAGFTHLPQPDCGLTTLHFFENGSAIFGKGLWQWQFGNGNTSNLQNPTNAYTSEGVYNVKLVLTGLSGCKDSITLPVRVDIQKIPRGTIIGDTVGCIGQTLRWQGLVDNVDGPVSLRWLLGDGRQQVDGNTLSAIYPRGGTFTVSMITQTNFGCSDTARRLVQVSLDPLVNAGPDLRVCKGETVQLRATGAATYQWSPSTWLSCADCPNPVVQATDNISYVVTGFNSIGCKATDTLHIEVPQPFRINYSASDTICLGEDKQLQAGGAQRYVWSPAADLNNATIANPVATPGITTTYRVVGYDNANCFTDTGYVTIEVGRIPTVDIGNGGSFVAGTTVPLTPRLGNGPFAQYAWTPTTGLSCADCPNPIVTVGTNITYTLQVTSPLGCSATDTVSFRVQCVQAEQVYIPNAFSPDGDGVNDVFMVRGKGLARVKSFRVFNRFGQVVFEKQNFAPNDPAHGWNGRINGVPASPDVYVYVAELLCTGGASYLEKGNVTLMR